MFAGAQTDPGGGTAIGIAEGGDVASCSNRHILAIADRASDAPRRETGRRVPIDRCGSSGTMKIFREVISDLPSD